MLLNLCVAERRALTASGRPSVNGAPIATPVRRCISLSGVSTLPWTRMSVTVAGDCEACAYVVSAFRQTNAAARIRYRTSARAGDDDFRGHGRLAVVGVRDFLFEGELSDRE